MGRVTHDNVGCHDNFNFRFHAYQTDKSRRRHDCWTCTTRRNRKNFNCWASHKHFAVTDIPWSSLRSHSVFVLRAFHVDCILQCVYSGFQPDSLRHSGRLQNLQLEQKSVGSGIRGKRSINDLYILLDLMKQTVFNQTFKKFSRKLQRNDFTLKRTPEEEFGLKRKV